MTATIECPRCGADVFVKVYTGRPPMNIPVKNVSDALRKHYRTLRRLHNGKVRSRAVRETAKEFETSSAYIYQVVKQAGLTVAGILEGIE